MIYSWLIVAIVLSIIELGTISLVSVWFIASALISLLLALFGFSLYIQIVNFVILGIILLIFTRKPLLKYLNKTKQKTNADRILDMTGVVTEEIDIDQPGEVKVDGKKWTAMAKEKIAKGKKVKILKIEGVKLLVEEEK